MNKFRTEARSLATKYVAFVVDDSLNGRELGADPYAVVREAGKDGFEYGSVLVGWQCGFEPLFVAVHSYLDAEMNDEEAEELAGDYLEERGWFSGGRRTEPNYVVR